MSKVFRIGSTQVALLPRNDQPVRVTKTQDGHTWIWLKRVLLTDCICYDLKTGEYAEGKEPVNEN